MYIKLPNIIKIIYNINDIEYTIYTKFIPVIIDYGRSHINCSNLDSTLITSEEYAQKACNSKCNPSDDKSNCEINSLWINKSNGNWSDNSNSYYINPRVKNESFDLRFINSIMQLFRKTDIKQKYMKKVNILNNPDWFNKDKTVSFGVQEHEHEDKKIENTTDVIDFLTEYYRLNYLTVPIIYQTNETIKIDCNIDKKVKWTYENINPKVEPAKVKPTKVEPAKVKPTKVEPAKVKTTKVDPKIPQKFQNLPPLPPSAVPKVRRRII
jgi:hypothetical protein